MLVGEEEKKFLVHEAVIHANSAFFDAALRADWVESTERCVKLPEENAATFHHYARWVYTHRLCIEKVEERGNFTILSRLYGLGKHLADCDFQDAIIDDIIAETVRERMGEQWLPNSDAIGIIYAYTLPGDQARRLMVDMHLISIGGDSLDEEFDDDKFRSFVHEVASALLRKVADARTEGDHTKGLYMPCIASIDLDSIIAKDGKTCKYHNHGEDRTCYSEKYA